jgi:hypothetical protein
MLTEPLNVAFMYVVSQSVICYSHRDFGYSRSATNHLSLFTYHLLNFAPLRDIFPYLAAFPAFPRVSLALRAERNTFRRANDMRPLDTKPR